MKIDVNGTRLWFDVEGSALVPAGSEMMRRDGAGHFSWMDAPERYWPMLIQFISSTASAS